MALFNEDNTGSAQLNVTSRVKTKHADEYIRPKTVTFIGTGLKPNTIYWPFFDDVFVGHLCVPGATGGATAPPVNATNATNTTINQLKTNNIGEVYGYFFLPAQTFKGHDHTFKLVDRVKTSGSSIIADPLYGIATAEYTVTHKLKNVSNQKTDDNADLQSTRRHRYANPNAVFADDSAAVKTSGPQLLETWYFEYTVTTVTQEFFTVTTTSSTAPSTSSVRNEVGLASSGNASIELISSTSVPGGKWAHKYSASSKTETRTLRQEKTVAKLATDSDTLASLPSLTTFRPSGVNDNDVINIKKSWSKIGPASTSTNYGENNSQRYDSLAQSFLIDAASYPDGLFATSIKVFFKTVDQSTPVILELREMSNGTPSSTILPNGSVTIPGYAAAASSDASIGTVFRFDSPIYLKPSVEYCFVIKSTSMGYNAWCSQVGQIDINTGLIIDAQPFTGVLFKSDNDKSWTPDRSQDMKFDLYKADFDTTKTAKLKFWPRKKAVVGATSVYYHTGRTLSLGNISTTRGSKDVVIKVRDHGLKSSDYVFIDNINMDWTTSLNGLTPSGLRGQFVATVIDEDQIQITSTSATFANISGPFSVPDSTDVYSTNPPITPKSMIFTSAVEWKDSSNFSPAMIPAATGPTLSYPEINDAPHPYSFKIYVNQVIDEFLIDYVAGLTNTPHTAVSETINLARATVDDDGYITSFGLDENLDIDPDDFYVGSTGSHYLINPVNETLHATELANGKKSLEVNMTLSSTNKDVSPTVDLSNIGLIKKRYTINNQRREWSTSSNIIFDNYGYVIKTVGNTPWATYGYSGSTGVIGGSFVANLNSGGATGIGTGEVYKISEILPNVGTAVAKYKSAVILLNNSYNTMNIRVGGTCPRPAQFDVYIRTSSDEATHGDQSWTWLPIDDDNTNPFDFDYSESDKLMKEWTYKYTSDNVFDVFDLKIVMRSTNKSIVPKIHKIQANAQLVE